MLYLVDVQAEISYNMWSDLQEPHTFFQILF